MSKLEILIKMLTLLYREKEIENDTSDSKDLVRTVLSVFTSDNRDNQFIGGDGSVEDDLKHLILDLLNNPDNYDKVSLLQSINLIFKNKPDLCKIVTNAIDNEFSQASLKRTVVSIRNLINNYYKEEKLKATISKASYQMRTGKLDGDTITAYTQKLITALEALSLKARTKDPGIMDELDIGDENGLGAVLNKVKNQKVEGGKLLSGWKELNEMTQNGFRRGIMCMIAALQHNYKSGFMQSLFMQFAMHNKPALDDPTKKPLILYISFEDDSEVFTEFMYRYLYYNENNELPDLTKVTGAEVASYIRKRLSVNGYHVKMMRVNPSEWTYKSLFNKVLELEANGYEIHAMLIDYLYKLPTTGCVTSGPTGNDVLDLFNRVRNFSSAYLSRPI